MGFDGLYGNDALKTRLSASLSKGQLSHCYLITGPAGSGKRTLARLLCAALECTGAADKPCGQCRACKKVLGDNHPDILTLDDTEHKEIPVKLVRAACAELSVRPNEGAKKLLYIPRAQTLSKQDQNALLKCIEEPPAYAAFLLLAEHAEQLLPTVRSRCAELKMAPLSPELLLLELRNRFSEQSEERLQAAIARSDGFLGQAETILRENTALLPQSLALLKAYGAADAVSLLYALQPLEKLKREQLRPILLECYEAVASALTCRKGAPARFPVSRELAAVRSDAALLQTLKALRECSTLLEANVGIGHLCGLLSVQLR